MSRAIISTLKAAAIPLLLFPGCLVSFNDYPLGRVQGEAGAAPMNEGGAGAGSGAGAPAADGGELSDPENVIDDFEDEDHAILEQQGRRGHWYIANDGRGAQTPSTDQDPLPLPLDLARGESTRGVRTFGGPFPVWGALLGTTLASDGNSGAPYDLRPYRGLRVWIRAGSFGDANRVRINFVTAATQPGGGCSRCGDHFGMYVPISAEWTRATVPFSNLSQAGFGTPKLPAPELGRVLSIQFSFGPNVTFDLWVDDLELY